MFSNAINLAVSRFFGQASFDKQKDAQAGQHQPVLDNQKYGPKSLRAFPHPLPMA
jgi:hypothetical protein